MKIKKIILIAFIISIALFLLNQLVAEAVMLNDEKSKAVPELKMQFGSPDKPSYEKPQKPEYAPNEIIIKFKPNIAANVKTITSLKTGLKAQGSSLNAMSGVPKNINALLKDKTTLEPVFKGLHRKMLAQKKTEEQLNIETFQKLSREGKISAKGPKNYNLSNIYILKNIDTKGKPIELIAKELSSDPNIEYAQPNYLMELCTAPNDPYYHSSGSWGQDYDDLWGLKSDKLNCAPAWNISQGQGVVVAVIDTGVDYNHEDLAENIWRNTDEIPNNGIDDDNNGYVDDVRGYDFSGDEEVGEEEAGEEADLQSIQADNDPIDNIGHGTHCAGTIAAVGNNGKGIIGVVPKAKIMPIKIFPNAYSNISAEAIIYAADNGAKVLSNSWGPGGRESSNPVIEEAIDHAYDKGCVVVFAAGNDNDDVAYYSPANYPKVISVAATDHNDQRASFSNYGYLISVSAPGGDSGSMRETPTSQHYYSNILSLRAHGTDMYNDPNNNAASHYTPGEFVVGNDYYRSRGTSMACPHVAGLCALILSKHPNYTIEEVKNQLIGATDDIDLKNPGYAGAMGGRINAFKALIQTPIFRPRIFYNGYSADYDGNGAIEQGETVELKVKLKNYGKGQAADVALRISTDDPNIQILQGSASYNSIGSNDSLTSEVISDQPFLFKVLYTKPLFEPIKFRLYISYRECNFTELDMGTFEVKTNIAIKQLNANFNGLVSPKIDIYNDKVVWAASVNGNMDIYMYDTKTQEITQITNDEFEQRNPAIYGCNIPGKENYRIVWQDKRNGNWDIYMYDNATRKETQITYDADDQVCPDIYFDENNKGAIVWQGEKSGTDPNTGNSGIYAYVFGTTNRKCIISDSSCNKAPKVYKDKIAWCDSIPFFNPVHDLSKNKLILLVSAGFDYMVSAPAIYENKVAYSGLNMLLGMMISRFPHAILVFDISKRTSRVDPFAIIMEVYPDILFSNLALYGNNLFFTVNMSSIIMADLTNGNITVIDSRDSQIRNLNVDQNKIVWSEKNNNSCNVYMAELFYPAPNSAKFISQSVPSNMKAKHKYTVNITYMNTGTTSWQGTKKGAEGYKLGSQNPRDNSIWRLSRVNIASTEIIKPGQTKTFTFNVTAPKKPGTYNFQWQMLQEFVQWFGDLTPNAKINVKK